MISSQNPLAMGKGILCKTLEGGNTNQARMCQTYQSKFEPKYFLLDFYKIQIGTTNHLHYGLPRTRKASWCSTRQAQVSMSNVSAGVELTIFKFCSIWTDRVFSKVLVLINFVITGVLRSVEPSMGLVI